MDEDFGGLEEFDGLIVDVPEGVRFAAVYSPQPVHGRQSELPPTYGASVPIVRLPEGLQDEVPYRRRDESLASCRTSARIEVVPVFRHQSTVRPDRATRAEELKLSELLQRLDARNLSRDRLFSERPVQLELRGLRYGPEMVSTAWRHLPMEVRRAYEGKFKLIPTRMWVLIGGDE